MKMEEIFGEKHTIVEEKINKIAGNHTDELKKLIASAYEFVKDEEKGILAKSLIKMLEYNGVEYILKVNKTPEEFSFEWSIWIDKVKYGNKLKKMYYVG